MPTAHAVREILRTHQTAGLIMYALGSKLYRDLGACLWELVRNGVVACMKGDKWEPGVGEVEVRLARNHPLAPGDTALVVFDRGSGFTRPKLKQFCNLGQSLDDILRLAGLGTNAGTAQKRVGRFAALALNRVCSDGDPTTGFFVLTRTSEDGPVMFITVNPAEFERDQGFGLEIVSPNAAELGPYRGVNGSFTAIVIPNAVFKNEEEIRGAIRWYVPRKRDRMFRLLVDSKPVIPPPLPRGISMESPTGIGAYLDRCDNEEEEGGIWFADAETGLRVAAAATLPRREVPYPLARPDLVGDIFVPGLYAHQKTDRSGIDTKFFRSAAWRQVTSWLLGQVVPKAKELLGDDDVIDEGDFGELALDFVDLCHEIYGEPPDLDGPPFDLGGGRKKRPGGGGGGGGGGGKRPPTGNGRPRCIPFVVDGETYFLGGMEMEEIELAEVYEGRDYRTLYVNNGQYTAAPKSREARREHMIMRVLEAIGRSKFPVSARSAADFMAEHRRRLLDAKGKKAKSR